MSKLPILMYHSLTADSNLSSGLTISVAKFKAQLQYLKDEGYTTFHFKDLENNSDDELPQKSVIITFDDVYINQLELAVPILESFNFKACFYVPFKYVNGHNDWDEGSKPIMSVEQLKSLDPNVIELGMHSYAHGNFKTMTLDAIEGDFEKANQFIADNGLDIHQTIAFPYGKFPRKGKQKNNFFGVLVQNNIKYGLRIGNRVNSYPFKNNFEIQRLDIKGEDSLKTFKRKLKHGKSLLF